MLLWETTLIWRYKGALFKMDASVFLEWGAQHQHALLKKSEAKRPILATQLFHQILLDITKELFSPHMLEIEIPIPYGQSSYLHIAEHFEPPVFSPGEFWWHMLDFRENGTGFCWGHGAGVLHCLNWQQVLTAAFLSCLRCDTASSDIALTGRHDGRQRTTTPACVVLRYSKKLVWILQEGLWCGDPRLQVLPASCFLLCMAHLWYFFYIFFSISCIHILLQLSTNTSVPLQKNMAHENTSQRAMPEARVRRQMSEKLPKAPNLSREAGCKHSVEVTKL